MEGGIQMGPTVSAVPPAEKPTLRINNFSPSGSSAGSSFNLHLRLTSAAIRAAIASVPKALCMGMLVEIFEQRACSKCAWVGR